MIPGLKKRVFNFHDLLMYVALARKHVRLMALLMCLMLLIGLNWYVFARPVYQGRALVRLDYVVQPLDTEKLYHDSRISLVSRELMSDYMLERTAKALGLRGDAKYIRLMYIFKEHVVYTAEKNLEIEVFPSSPFLAHRWSEELVRQFGIYRQERRDRDRDVIVQTYLKQMQEVTGKIEETRNARFDKHDEQNVTATEIEVGKMKSIPTDLVYLHKRIDDVGRVQVRLHDPSLDPVAKLSLIASLDDKANGLGIGQDVKVTTESQELQEVEKEGGIAIPGQKTDIVVLPSMAKPSEVWENLAKQAEQIKQSIANASRTYLPGHRIMIGLRKELDGVNQKIDGELQLAENRLSVQYQDLLNRRAELEAKLPAYEEINKRMSRINQDAKIFEASHLPWQHYYTDMKKKLEALDYANDKERIDIDYLGLTFVNDSPISPTRGKVAAVAIAMGLVLAIGIPFLIEYLDHTMSNLEQVESVFQLRGLGIVPKVEDQSAGRVTLITREKYRESNLVENFRVIRTNLLSMGALTKPAHVTMVTSAMPREGKTVVSSNLAISFSQTGARTLLIDTDLRRGRLHRLFGYRKSPGLSDVLMGECTLDDALRPTVHENLTILSAGKHIDTGTELLGSERFRQIMAGLREKYDRIVVDTPPVLGLSETSVLQSLMDGVLFVIWSGSTPTRMMQAAIEMLQANGANFYGFVLNRLDLNATTNYYQYYYYSHDYYYHSTQSLENA